MTIAEKFIQEFDTLCEEYQAEVLDFVTFMKEKQDRIKQAERAELDEIWRLDREMDEGLVKTLTLDELMMELRT